MARVIGMDPTQMPQGESVFFNQGDKAAFLIISDNNDVYSDNYSADKKDCLSEAQLKYKLNTGSTYATATLSDAERKRYSVALKKTSDVYLSISYRASCTVDGQTRPDCSLSTWPTIAKSTLGFTLTDVSSWTTCPATS